MLYYWCTHTHTRISQTAEKMLQVLFQKNVQNVVLGLKTISCTEKD